MADDLNDQHNVDQSRAFGLDDLVDTNNLFGEPTSTNFMGDADLSHHDNSRLTVSPEETLLQIPGSTTMTNFTTPSLYDGSPDTDFETSPFIHNNDFGRAPNWPSLFPDATNNDTTFESHKENVTNASLLQPLEMSRTESSSSMEFKTPVSPDEARQHRRSLIDGVNKGKRTSRGLAPIDVDNADGAAVKRAKNTMAARKSRQKKRDIEDALRVELERMTRLKEYWMHKAIARGEPIPRPGQEPDI